MLLTRRPTGLADRLDALQEVLKLSRERLDPVVVADAEQIAAKAGERLRFGEAHTVVALAGATGSGKSSLFNMLVGEPLSTVGMRRPTTDVAHAAVWGSQDATSLLDWLEVPAATCWAPNPSPSSTVWSCWTFPTSTRSSRATAWRPSGWSSGWTCWSGCWIRRSTPMRPARAVPAPAGRALRHHAHRPEPGGPPLAGGPHRVPGRPDGPAEVLGIDL